MVDNKKLKILIVNPCYPPAFRYGGPVKSVHELGRKLVEIGVDVTVFTTNADGPYNLDVPIGEEVNIDSVKVFYFRVEKPRSYFRSPQLSMALKERVRDFDMVHINWLYVYPTLIAARECISREVAYILSPRGMLDPNAITMKGTLKKKVYLNLIEKRHLKCANAVHFTSYGERAQAISAGWKINSVVVPNGINLSQYDVPANDEQLRKKYPGLIDKRIVLFLGRLNYIKGLDLLAKAWPFVIKEIPDAHLILAGPDDDGYGKKVRKWLKEGGVEQHATFTGILLGDDKLSALAAADLFVAPSYLESFGMAIVEAMACRKPVIITDRVNICREVEEAGAGLVTTCDPKRIADTIVDLLKKPDRCREMGLKARTLVETRFTLEAAANEMLRAYRRIASF